MNIRCAKDSLLQVISATQRITPAKPVVQALSGILVDAENNVVIGTDLEISVKCPLEATINEKGSILVSSRYFLEIIKSLPNSPIEIKSKENVVHISAGKSNFTLNTLPTEEFPQLSEAGDKKFEINTDKLLTAINHVLKAAARDDARPILTGVYLKLENNEIEFAATDSYRLAVYKTEVISEQGLGAQYIIPGRVLDELSRLAVSYISDKIIFMASDNLATFKLGDVELTTRLFEGNYPNYSQLIPDEFTYQVKANKSDILESIRRSSIIVEGSPIRLKIGYSQIETTAQNQSVGSSSDVFECESNIESLEAAFNPQYFIDGIQSFDSSSKIELNLNDSSKPMMLKSPDEKDFYYIIMPMRIS